MSRRGIAILAALVASRGIAQPSDPQIVLRSTVQEVLLDFIARDKHQKLVTGLRAEDIEILEDGVPQKIRSFQYRDGRHTDGPASAPTGSGSTSAPLREINVVSLVFEGLSGDSRRQATHAAKDFLASEVNPNTYIGVFTLNHRVALLQQYTNDIALLNQAVDRVASGTFQKFAKDIEAQVAVLNRMAPNATNIFQPIRPGSAEEQGPVALDRLSSVEVKMAQVTIAILTRQAGSLSIDALHELIRAQSQLPGRKTILYFSEGLIVPPEQPEGFRGVISDANRANVAFYTVDPSGLDTMSRPMVSGRITEAIGSEDPGAPSVMPTNNQENLRALAEDTGGFAIANTNDTKAPLRRVMEEVRAHYEVAYASTSSNYDGHFRTIKIRALRPSLHLQTRKGYFALPALGGETLAPFEFAALTVLNNKSLPQAFDFHAGVLTFRATAQSTECRAVFSVPSRALHFTEDSQAKLFNIHLSFLGLVKDDQDQVVRKISHDLLFQAPLSKRAGFERGEVTVTLPLSLPPGRYHLEAVALDRDAETASARKIALFIPSPELKIALSDLVLVRGIQPVAGDRDPTDPLEFSGGKVTPEMSSAVAESVYFVLYPNRGTPEVRIAVSRNDKLVSSERVSLPVADADGSIRILARIPLGGAGVYEIAIEATQGGATARRTTAIEVK